MKKAIKNFLTDAFPEIIMIFLNLILLKLFYGKLGTNIYALYQIFSQFFAYLVLAEAGFSSCALVSLYKPMAENNIKEINKKLSGIRYIFRNIGIVILTLAVIISFIIPFTIKENTFNYFYIIITFILYSISNSVNYFFFTYRIYYDAREEKYVPNIVYQVGFIIKYIVEIILLLLGASFEIVLIGCIICNLLTNFFMKQYTLKNEKNIKLDKNNKDTSMINDTKDLIIHKISGVIANNIDIVLISMNLGLKKVAIYGAYNYILNEINKIITKIGTSLYSIVGKTYFDKNKHLIDKNKFIQYNSFLFFLAIIISSSLVFSYNSFINIFYGNDMVASKIVSYLFIIMVYIQIIRTTLNTYLNGCGLFKDTKICAITEGIINLILSLIFVKYFEMAGILIATIISLLISDFIIKPIIIKNNLKIFTMKEYYREFFAYSLIGTILIVLNSFIFKFSCNNLIEWFFISTLIFVFNTIITFIIFKLIGRISWLKDIKNVIFKKKSKEEI